MTHRPRAVRTSVVVPKKTKGFHALVEAGDLALGLRKGDEAAGNYVRALSLCEQAQPDLLVRLACANVIRDRLDEAELCFSDALELEPRNTAALRGLIELHRVRDEHGAAFWAEERLFLAVPKRARVAELVESGDRWWARNDARRAKMRYAAALTLDVRHPRARDGMRAAVNAELGNVSMTETLSGGIRAHRAG